MSDNDLTSENDPSTPWTLTTVGVVVAIIGVAVTATEIVLEFTDGFGYFIIYAGCAIASVEWIYTKLSGTRLFSKRASPSEQEE